MGTIGLLLPKNQPGARRTDHQQVIGGVVHALKTGCRWRDCPAGYGPSMTVYNRFRHWMMRGIWRRLFDALARADSGDGQPSTARRPRPTAWRRAEKGGAGDWPFARPPQHENPRHRRRAWTPHRHRSDAWPSRRRSRRGSLDHRSSGRRLLGCRRRLRQRWSASLLLKRGTVPVIPNNPTRKRHHRFDKPAYRRHNLIARMFCRLKDWRRIATRYDKLAANLAAAAVMSAALIVWGT
jgi:transposase